MGFGLIELALIAGVALIVFGGGAVLVFAIMNQKKKGGA